MAVLKLSALVTRISGKIGGSVFAKTSNGQVVKKNTYSQPQFSPSQTIAQQKIQRASSSWLTLSESQKNDWLAITNDYPFYNKVGEVSYYGGYQLFLKLNNNLIVAGLPIIKNAPVFDAVNYGNWLSWFMTISSLCLQLDGLVIGQKIIFYGTEALSTEATDTNKIYRKITTFTISAVSEIFCFFSEFLAVYPNPAFGQVYFFKYRIISATSGNSTNFSYSQRVIVT